MDAIGMRIRRCGAINLTAIILTATVVTTAVVTAAWDRAAVAQNGSDLTGNLTDRRNGGVAGTGLGTVPRTNEAGTGNSVQGPPGQGINGTGTGPIGKDGTGLGTSGSGSGPPSLPTK